MKAKKIITVPHPSLRRKSEPIKSFGKKTRQLARALIETMEQAKEENQGVGLAAVQIGIRKQMLALISRPSKKAVMIINPQIIWQDQKLTTGSRGKKTDYEGCLSVPGLWGIVKRPATVKVRYQDLKGKWQERDFLDFLGRVVQHEIDHLNGILFVDRVIEQKGRLFQGRENELIEVTIK